LPKESKNNILEQMYSCYNEHGEFEVTGYTSGYKEKGHYKDPIEITNESVKRVIENIEDKDDCYCVFGLEADEDGDILGVKTILPLM
jgi:hypothetical protein